VGTGLVEPFPDKNASGCVNQRGHRRARSLLRGVFPGIRQRSSRHSSTPQMRVSKANGSSYSIRHRDRKQHLAQHAQRTDPSGDHDMYETMQRLFQFKAWANDELLTALAKLGRESPIAGLAIKALSHTYVVDRI